MNEETVGLIQQPHQQSLSFGRDVEEGSYQNQPAPAQTNNAKPSRPNFFKRCWAALWSILQPAEIVQCLKRCIAATVFMFIVPCLLGAALFIYPLDNPDLRFLALRSSFVLVSIAGSSFGGDLFVSANDAVGHASPDSTHQSLCETLWTTTCFCSHAIRRLALPAGRLGMLESSPVARDKFLCQTLALVYWNPAVFDCVQLWCRDIRI